MACAMQAESARLLFQLPPGIGLISGVDVRTAADDMAGRLAGLGGSARCAELLLAFRNPMLSMENFSPRPRPQTNAFR
jgi:hypothetical protein